MATFTSTTDGNINDGGTYGNTSPGTAGVDFPGTNDICVVGGSTTVTLNTNFECRAIKISGELAGGSNTLTVNGATSNKPFDHDGEISGDLNLIITNTGMQQNGLLLDGSGVSGNINDLTINLTSATASNNTIEFTPSLVLDNTLTVTAGVFQPYASTFSLTVGGHIFGNGTFNANDSTVTVAGQCAPANVGLIGGSITTTDDFRPTTKTTITGDGTITANGGAQIGGLFDIGATNTPTLQAGRLHNTLDIPSGNQGQSTFNLALNENSTNGPARHVFFYHLTLDSEGTENNTYTMQGAITCTGNLTITDGVIDTGSNHALTVGTDTDDGGATGHLRIKDAGELVCNSSTVIVGSVYCQIAAGSNGTGFAELNLPDSSGSFTVRGPEVSNYVFRLDNQAECNHNGGTVTFSLTAENNPSIMDVTSLRGTGVNNILVTQSVRTSNGSALEFVGSDNVKGNLTLTGNGSQSCVVDTNFTAASLTIDGDVTVNNHATFIKRTTNTGNYSFGSLEINSGGTYNATSGTTTIKSRTTGGFSWYAQNTGATFNHNNGTVKFTLEDWTGADETFIQAEGFYNVEFAANTSAREFRYNDVSGGGLTVFNNFTISEGRFRFNTGGDSVTVHGLTKMSGGQYGNTGTAPSGTHNYLGGITMLGGAWQTTSGTLNTSGLRILGGTFA